ncbi:MAG TPA: VTT domain-containing protein [Steroidobacter sp.]
MGEHSYASLFEIGRNCWRVERAERAAFIVDARDYFSAFVEAARRAERSIYIVGWDFNSRTRLKCSDERDGDLELGSFLNDLVRARRELRIHILIWDFPMIFGLDREWAPLYGLGWKPHRRISFRYDNTHPLGGSHHQKIVVIDDRLAFSGGIDLTSRRWDTCDHAPSNEHRLAKGEPYPPFHDVMMAVEGPAAAALADLVRERWRRATHERLTPPGSRRRKLRPGPAGPQNKSLWPDHLEPDVRDVTVAISRTEPAVDDTPGVREVERLYLDMIRAARRSIYLENQYFTAEKIGEALAARLREPDGPEVIVVLRELSHGWLEERTMHWLRTRLIQKLRAADAHDRLRICYPYIAGLESGTCIDVHSKVTIVDDEWLRIGSANLANRSLGLDTECDLTVEARGREDVRRAIASFRSRLLAEHLGFPRERVEQVIEQSGSLRAAMAALSREDRTLKPLTVLPHVPEALLSVVSVADPEKPVAIGDLVKLLGSEAEPEASALPHGPAWGKLALIAAGLVALGALWNYTPLARLLDVERVIDWAARFGREWWAPIATMLAYTPAAFVLFPRPVITLFCVIAFGPLAGFIYAMLGIQLAAWATFMAGTRLDRSTVRRLAGRRLNDILHVLRRRGLLATTALRLVPLAPFAVEGVVAGAIRVKLWHFQLGTAIGMMPGTLTSTVFGDQLKVWIEDPSRINYWLIALALLLLVVASWGVRRWLAASVSETARHGVGARAV